MSPIVCPSCHSGTLDLERYCGFCGATLTIERELALRAVLPPLRTKRIEDDRIDLAIREAGG